MPPMRPPAAMCRSSSASRGCADGHAGAVVEQQVERLDVVDGLAAHQRMNAAGVIADHAAEGAAAVRGGVGSEGQLKLFRRLAYTVEHDAGLDAHGAGDGIDRVHVVHVLREVEDDGGVAGLAGDRGAASAREDGRVEAAADGDRGDDIVLVARDDEADGDVAIVRGVGGVGGFGGSVEADLAANLFAKPFFKFGGGGKLFVRAGVGAGQKNKGRRRHECYCSPNDSRAILWLCRARYGFSAAAMALHWPSS